VHQVDISDAHIVGRNTKVFMSTLWI